MVNDPPAVRNAPEKVFVLDYRALHAADAGHAQPRRRARRSWREHGEIVVKPLHGNGGKAIFKIDADGTNLSALIEVFNQTWPEPHMVQPFLPDVAEGDKRIVLVDGEVAGRDQPHAGRGRDPLQPRGRRLGREGRADAARGGNLRRAGARAQARAG